MGGDLKLAAAALWPIKVQEVDLTRYQHFRAICSLGLPLILGNIAQIDTPYLTEGSSGLTYVVDRFKGWRHGGHITLARGERSRLADHAAEAL